MKANSNSFAIPDTVLNTSVPDTLLMPVTSAPTETLDSAVILPKMLVDSGIKFQRKKKLDLNLAQIDSSQRGFSIVNDSIPLLKRDTVIEASKKEIEYTAGIFANSQIHKQGQAELRSIPHKEWILVMLLLSISIVAVINVLFHKKLTQLFKSFLNPRFAQQMQREENSLLKRVSVFLSVCFLVVAGIYAYYVVKNFNFPMRYTRPFPNFLFYCSAFLSFYLVKFLLYYGIGYIFDSIKLTKDYVFDVVLFNQILGLLLIPIVILLTYVSAISPMFLIYLGAFLFAVFFLSRIVRAYLSFGFGKGISNLYLFLYLCTLEILPLAFVAKVILRKI